MYAIIRTGGKQYRVEQGEQLQVEKLNAEVGDTVTFDVLMQGEGGDVKIGAPVVEGASVTAKVLEHGKGPKIRVFKYKPKKDYRRSQGHRQPYSLVEFVSIG